MLTPTSSREIFKSCLLVAVLKSLANFATEIHFSRGKIYHAILPIMVHGNYGIYLVKQEQMPETESSRRQSRSKSRVTQKFKTNMLSKRNCYIMSRIWETFSLFQITNPGWKPPVEGGKFLASVKERVIRDADKLANLGQNALSDSLHALALPNPVAMSMVRP